MRFLILGVVVRNDQLPQGAAHPLPRSCNRRSLRRRGFQEQRATVHRRRDDRVGRLVEQQLAEIRVRHLLSDALAMGPGHRCQIGLATECAAGLRIDAATAYRVYTSKPFVETR